MTAHRSDDPSFLPYTESPTAPIIYFDVSSAHGVMNGVVQVELAGRTLTPRPSGAVLIGFIPTARLRCSPAAARDLRDAIDKALEMLEQAQQQPTVAAGRLN